MCGLHPAIQVHPLCCCCRSGTDGLHTAPWLCRARALARRTGLHGLAPGRTACGEWPQISTRALSPHLPTEPCNRAVAGMLSLPLLLPCLWLMVRAPNSPPQVASCRRAPAVGCAQPLSASPPEASPHPASCNRLSARRCHKAGRPRDRVGKASPAAQRRHAAQPLGTPGHRRQYRAGCRAGAGAHTLICHEASMMG